MKEMLKSKYLVLFVIFMLGVSYFNSVGLEKLNDQNINNKEIIMKK